MRRVANNFSAGEWSPFLDTRSDLQKYDSACLNLKNFRPLPWGGASYRAGLEFFGFAKNANAPCRLIPFNYSTTLSYQLELGNNYIRFWYSNGTPVTIASAPPVVSGLSYVVGDYGISGVNFEIYYCILGYTSTGTDPSADPTHWVQQNVLEIPTPWPTSYLRALQLKQINAEIRFVHALVEPYTLTYGGATTWSLAPTVFKYPVLLDQNAVQTLTMALSSVSVGSATLTASAPAYVPGGTYYPPETAMSYSGQIYESTVEFTSTTFAQDFLAGNVVAANPFNVGQVGAAFEIQQLRPADSVIMGLNASTGVYACAGNVNTGAQSGALIAAGTAYATNTWYCTPTILMDGSWTFDTSQFWDGDVQVQRSIDGGQTWTVIRDFTAQCDQNYSTSGTEDAPNIGYPPVLYRVCFNMRQSPFTTGGSTPNWVGSAPTQYAPATATLESEDAYIAGLVTVTGYTDPTHVTVNVLISPYSTAATYLWSEGAFSTYRGFPQAIAFYEQRILYSGTAYQPNWVWGSVTADFDNFQYSDEDDGAVAFQPAVAQQNRTGWMATLLRVHIGTAGEEIIMASGNLDEPLTPSNVTVRAQSYYGSSAIQPLLLQNSIIFVERNGMRVREMRELSPYVVPTDFVAPDLTLMAEHITQPGGIVQMDFGRLPDPLAFFIRSDGVMPVMTYNREQNIVAWAQYITAGSFESVSAIYGAPADEVWVSCQRVLNGQTVRTIEGFTIDPAENANLSTNLLLDCGLQFLAGVTNPVTGTQFVAGAVQLAGLTYLANTTVTAVIDGAEYAGLVVGNTGVLPFPPNVTAQSVVNVGLPYVGYLSPMKPEQPDQGGPSQGARRRVCEVTLRVRKSVAVEYCGGENPVTGTSNNWQRLPFRSTSDTEGTVTQFPQMSDDGVGDFKLPGPWPDGFGFGAQINLRQSHPQPLTILGIFYKWDLA